MGFRHYIRKTLLNHPMKRKLTKIHKVLKINIMAMAFLALAGFVGPRCEAMSVVPPSFSTLVQSAEQVVRAEATASESRWDATPQGGQVIHTYVQFRVLRTLKGAAQETLTIRMLGGQVGPTAMEIPDMPSFQVGSRYILFVAQNGRAFCPLVGVLHGAYQVVTDQATGAERVVRANGEPLASPAGVSSPIEPSIRASGAGLGGAMGREDFEAAIIKELGDTRHE